MRKKISVLLLLVFLCFSAACVGPWSRDSAKDSSVPTVDSSFAQSSEEGDSSKEDTSLPNEDNSSTTEDNSSTTEDSSSMKDDSSSEADSSGQSQAAQQLLAEQALQGLTLTERVTAGDVMNLRQEADVDGNKVTFTYSVMQGDAACSLVGEKMFFSNPRKDQTVKIRVTATCGTAVSAKDYSIFLTADEGETLIETFEKGSVDEKGLNYTGGAVTAKRPNDANVLSLVEHNDSKALSVACQGEMPYGAYVGFYLNTKANTVYKVKLDLDAVGATTADLSASEYIYFEVYQNANMGIQTNRSYLYSANGENFGRVKKVSAFEQDGEYELLFSSADVDDGYAYVCVKVTKHIGEDVTLYLDNLRITECRVDRTDDFEYGGVSDGVFEGKFQVKTRNATLSADSYGDSIALKAETAANAHGYIGLKLNVEKGRTYQAYFTCDFIGESNTSYSNGTATGNSASVFVLENTENLADTACCLAFYNKKAVLKVNDVLPNLLMGDNEYLVTFTAAKDGYVYLVLRTNQIPEKAALIVDNLRLSDVTEEIYDHNGMGYLNGLGEPIRSSNVQDFDQECVAELMRAMNVQSTRMWFGTEIVKNWVWDKPLDEYVLDESIVAGYSRALDLLKQTGIKEITGMGLYMPITASSTSTSGNQHYVPLPQDGADYQKFLDAIYEIWYQMALAFPQIDIWEVGNESNHVDFIRHKTYRYLSYKDMAMITTDMIYYAYQGIKKANPKAIVLTPGFAPVSTIYNVSTTVEGENTRTFNAGIYSIELFLKYIYANIVSGQYPYHNNSKYVTAYDDDPDNYFQGVAWHPYDLGVVGYANTSDPYEDSFDVNLWVQANNACYKVMCDYGDEEKGVWFTEFGLSTKERNLVYSPVSHNSPYEYRVHFNGGSVFYTPDGNDANAVKQYVAAGDYYVTYHDYENYVKLQEKHIKAYFEAMNSDQMNYLHACHYFRMFGNVIDFGWNGYAGIYSGVFTEATKYLDRGLYPNHKAFILQEIYGGTGNLMEYSAYGDVHIGDKQVGSGLKETFDGGKLTNLSGNTVKYKGDMYVYSSNNNGNVKLENGALVVESEKDAYIAFKANGFEKGKTYTVSFEFSEKTSNTAFSIYTSNVSAGSWNNSSRIPLFDGTSSIVLISKLTVEGNVYSYTLTVDQDYDSLYFTIRNKGNLKIESVSVTVE